jgi:hypothetical protein
LNRPTRNFPKKNESKGIEHSKVRRIQGKEDGWSYRPYGIVIFYEYILNSHALSGVCLEEEPTLEVRVKDLIGS